MRGPILIGLLLVVALWGLPFRWTHDLDPGCRWKARPWSPEASWPMTARDRAAERRCWAARGAHSPDPQGSVNLLLRRWPSAAQLAAFDAEMRDEDVRPLLAGQ